MGGETFNPFLETDCTTGTDDKMKELKGKVAVITGAGSGFGRAFATLCAAEGMKLVLADIDEVAMEETGSTLAGTAFICQKCDVSNADDVKALAESAFAKFNGVNLLFNNAGVAVTGPSWTTSEQDWQWVLGVNLMGVVHGIQAFVPRMLQQNQPAHIVNTASLAGLSSIPGSSVYCVSKHGVVTLSECLHHELAQETADIGVSVLCPAFVPTGIADSKRNQSHSATADNETPYAEQLRRAVEAGRLSADDIARITIDAVKAGDFYILPHAGGARKSVTMRTEDIIEGKLPRDPAGGMFSHKN